MNSWTSRPLSAWAPPLRMFMSGVGKMRALAPKVRLGLLYYLPLPAFLRDAWFTPIIQPEAIHPYHRLINADLMAWAKARGCAVNTWTVNDGKEARRLADLGVDVIMSDVPDQIMTAL